jgi:hypothetical protein
MFTPSRFKGKGSLATNNSSKQQSKIIKKPIIKVHTKPAEFEGLVQKCILGDF